MSLIVKIEYKYTILCKVMNNNGVSSSSVKFIRIIDCCLFVLLTYKSATLVYSEESDVCTTDSTNGAVLNTIKYGRAGCYTYDTECIECVINYTYQVDLNNYNAAIKLGYFDNNVISAGDIKLLCSCSNLVVYYEISNPEHSSLYISSWMNYCKGDSIPPKKVSIKSLFISLTIYYLICLICICALYYILCALYHILCAPKPAPTEE